MEFCSKKIQRNGKKREYKSLRGDNFDVVLPEEEMKRGEKGHIQRTWRDVPKIIRADEEGLREVIVEARVGIREWSCVWRRDGRVETVF